MAKSAIYIVRLRRLSQISFLALFFFLFFHTQDRFGANQLKYPLSSFFYFDPLVTISVFFSAHIFKKIFLLSLITIILTLILGRVFCGWVCPLGTINQSISYLNKKLFRLKRYELYSDYQKIKYLIFISLVILFFEGINLTGIFDPLSFLTRGITPVFQYISVRIFQFLQYLNTHLGIFSHDKFFYWIQAYVNYFQVHFFRYAAITSFVLAAVLILNLAISRFWCRLVCPLGGLLGFFSLPAILNLQQRKKCQDCLECTKNCEGACQPHRKGEWKKQECIYCWNCIVSCPEGNLQFSFNRKKDFQKLDLGRRQIIYSIGASVLSAPLLKLGIGTKRANSKLIRPPGAGEEDEFLKRCIRCSQCIKVCPSNFLHPSLLEANLYGIWTPYGIGSLGYCKYDCNLCGRVCPSAAIKNLDLKEKQKTKIGTAFVDRGRCLPYASGIPCTACYDNCPVPGKAIWLKEIVSYDRYNMPITLQVPSVDLKKCIGCGSCEYVCPVTTLPAIYLTNTGESRAHSSRLLLTM